MMEAEGHANSELAEHSPRSWELAAAMLAGIVAAIFLSGHSVDDWPFEDTANYFSVARSVLNDDGLKTDLIYYPEQASFETIPAPQTVFPPGYSVVLAAVSKVTGASIERSAESVCLVSYACSAVLVFCVGVFAGLQRRSAWVVVAIWLSTASMWVYTWSAASEPLFMVLTMTAVACCGTTKQRAWPWVVAGIAAALAFSLRYVGVFLILTLGLAAVREYWFQFRRFFRWTIPVLGPSAVMMAVLFLRNHWLIGSWRGGNDYVSQSFGEVLIVFYYAVCRIVGFSRTALLQGEFVSLALTIGIAGLLVSALRAGAPGRVVAWCRSLSLRQSVIFLYGPISLALLFYLDITSNSGMTTRLLLPTMPFFLVTLAMLVEYAVAAGGWRRRMATVAVSLLVVGMIFGQKTALSEFHRDASIGRSVHAILQQPVSSGESLLSFLQQEVTTSSPVLSCQPQLAHFYLKCPLLGLPTTYFDKEQQQWTAQRTQAYAAKFGVGYVLLLSDESIRNDAEVFTEIAAGRIPDWMQLVERGPGYQLFSIR